MSRQTTNISRHTATRRPHRCHGFFILLLTLWFAVEKVTAAPTPLHLRYKSTPRRLSDSDNSNDYDDDGNYESTGNFATQAKDRVEDDIANMWATSPSGWIDEYWEVFGGTLLIIFSIFSCICFACCAPICCFEDRAPATTKDGTDGNVHAGGRPTLTQAQHSELLLKKKQRSKQTGDGLIKDIDETLPISKSAVAGTDSVAGAETTTATTPPAAGAAKAPKARRSLWNEFVSVWSEFLTGEQDEQEQKAYQRYEELQRRKSATGVKPGVRGTSKSRSSPRRRKRTDASVSGSVALLPVPSPTAATPIAVKDQEMSVTTSTTTVATKSTTPKIAQIV